MALQNLTKSSKAAAQDAQVVNTADAGGLRASSDTSAVARTGLWVLGLGLGGFLLNLMGKGNPHEFRLVYPNRSFAVVLWNLQLGRGSKV